MNSIFKTNVLLFFFIIFVQNYCFGQTNAGRLTLNGQAKANAVFVNEAKYPYAFFEAELGYVFVDRLMGLAEFRFEAYNDFHLFQQRYSARYSFVRMIPVEIYGGISYERSIGSFEINEFTGVDFVPVRTHQLRTKINLLVGSYYFINDRMAVEAQLGFPVLTYLDSPSITNQTPRYDSNLEGRIGLRYFFDKKRKTITITRDSSFSKKRMLGLSVEIAEDNLLDVTNLRRNLNLAFNFGYVLGRRGMIGIRTELSLIRERHIIRAGLSPFGRYYFWGLQRSKFYVEGQLTINTLHFNGTGRREKNLYTDAHLGLGWSKKVRENLRLDFYTGFKLFQFYNEEQISDHAFKSSDRLLMSRIGLEQYF